MKRIFFHNPLLVLSGLLISVTFTACQKQTSDATAAGVSDEIATAKTGTKPGTVTEVLLKVTINDATGYNITSDGGGDYVNNLQSVSAKIDQYGNFIFHCGLGGRGNNTYMIRWFNFNFSQPTEIFNTPTVNISEKGLDITTVKVAAYPDAPAFQNMIDGVPVCIGLTAGISGNSWVVNFHRNVEDFDGSHAAYAVVTRNGNTWTITPVGPCSPDYSNVAALRVSGELYAYYYMPFSFTLTKL